MQNEIPRRGKKRPQLDISIEQLHLDPQNPRLPRESQGKSEETVLMALYRYFDLRDLAESMSKNGYFDEEPLIAVPKDLPAEFKDKSSQSLTTNKEYLAYIRHPKTQYIVVEGNRRLASAILLLKADAREKLKIKGWPKISTEVEKDLLILPVIIYPKRDEIIPYLGIRHITGIKKWEPFAKARYIASLLRQYSIEDIEELVGDRTDSIKKFYLSYILAEEMEKESEGALKRVENNFSYLILALGQGSIKDYLGIPRNWEDIDKDQPVPKKNIKNLEQLFSFLFGDESKSPVLDDSRDITNKLKHIIDNEVALTYLIETRNLEEAFQLSGGEEQLVIKRLRSANRNLEYSLGKIHRHINEETIEEIKKCKDTVNQLLQVMGEKLR